MKRLVTLTAIAGIMVWSGNAWAGSSDTSDVDCGSVPAGWNAPKGAVVTSASEGGVIDPVINAIGENRSHSMMSHGANYWSTHSTMFSPGTNGWPTYCSTPLKVDDLKRGKPGVSQINRGAIFTYYW